MHFKKALVFLALSFSLLASFLVSQGFPKKTGQKDAEILSQKIYELNIAIKQLEEKKASLILKKEYCERDMERLLLEDRVAADNAKKFGMSFEAHAGHIQAEIDQLKKKKLELEKALQNLNGS